MNNQKNIDASIKNLEVQMGQLAKQLVGNRKNTFNANTKENLKEESNVVENFK